MEKSLTTFSRNRHCPSFTRVRSVIQVEFFPQNDSKHLDSGPERSFFYTELQRRTTWLRCCLKWTSLKNVKSLMCLIGWCVSGMSLWDVLVVFAADSNKFAQLNLIKKYSRQVHYKWHHSASKKQKLMTHSVLENIWSLTLTSCYMCMKVKGWLEEFRWVHVDKCKHLKSLFIGSFFASRSTAQQVSIGPKCSESRLPNRQLWPWSPTASSPHDFVGWKASLYL